MLIFAIIVMKMSAVQPIVIHELVLLNHFPWNDAIAGVVSMNHEKQTSLLLLCDVNIEIGYKQGEVVESRGDYAYRLLYFSNEFIRPLTTKHLKSTNQSTLSPENRAALDLVHKMHLSFMSEGRHNWHNNNETLDEGIAELVQEMPNETFLNGFYASVIRKYGINGLYYLHNKYFDDEAEAFFDQFYAKYLRLQPQSIRAANAVMIGDLVKIKPLKTQKNESLQLHARHFSDSFGQITSFVSGDLRRKNKRDQMEFAVQSLKDERMKLGLRPKYLYKVTKIHLHRFWNGFVDDPITRDQSFWDNQKNQILYLPYSLSDFSDERAIFSLSNFQNVIFAMHNQGRENVIIDPVTTAGMLLIERLKPSDDMFQVVFASLAFCMDKVNWPRIMRVVQKMKKSAKSKEKIFIEGIEKLFNVYYDKMMIAETKISEQFIMDRAQRALRNDLLCTNEFHNELQFKMQKDLRKAYGKNAILYRKLLHEISKETSLWIKELKPDYWREFGEYITFAFLSKIYRVSIIENYLKANANGNDLHVIYYGNKDVEIVQNLTVALAKKIDVEWNIHNMDESELLARRVVG